MECPSRTGQAGELIVAYIARTLDVETAADFGKHLLACAACRELTAGQEAVWSALEEWLPLAVSPGFDERLLRRITAEEHAQQGWWRRIAWPAWSWRPALPVAAACAVLVTAFLLKNFERAAAPATPVQPGASIEQVEHALDDMDMLKQLGVEAAAASPQS
ncbi:MAG: zf-HC2 domain-containing protein [Acidobacteriia bacterium]|nr:zf-HC2 domain-containing protein [Terriglobia bacterium]